MHEGFELPQRTAAPDSGLCKSCFHDGLMDVSADAVQRLHIVESTLRACLESIERGNITRLAGLGTGYQVHPLRLLAYDGDSRTCWWLHSDP